MNTYEVPKIEMLLSDTTDIIATSFGGDTPLEDEEW